jgi:hypothetical protein
VIAHPGPDAPMRRGNSNQCVQNDSNIDSNTGGGEEQRELEVKRLMIEVKPQKPR